MFVLKKKTNRSFEGEVIEIDCQFYDFSNLDYTWLKFSFSQLFSDSCPNLDLALLAELVVSQPYIGSIAKNEGRNGDHLAFITLIDFEENKVKSFF